MKRRRPPCWLFAAAAALLGCPDLAVAIGLWLGVLAMERRHRCS